MSTTFMNLDLPVVSQTLGPEWASELNTALEAVDAHDHTSGKGKPISLSALSVDQDFDLVGYGLLNVAATHFEAQSATLTGAPNASAAYVYAGDLWYTNGSGVPVQITSGGSVITTPSTVQALAYLATNTSVSIGAGDVTVTVAMDCSGGAKSVTLPLASAVATGRIYIVSDALQASETHNITVAPTGTDTINGVNASYTIRSNGQALFLQGDGAGAWVAI